MDLTPSIASSNPPYGLWVLIAPQFDGGCDRRGREDTTSAGTDLYENRVSLSGEGKSFYIDSMYLYENRVTMGTSVQVSST